MSIYSTLNAAKRSNGAKKHEEQKIMMKIHLATENYGQKLHHGECNTHYVGDMGKNRAVTRQQQA